MPNLLDIKTSPPRTDHNSIQRAELERKILANINKKLILISAGAGWGKTTLLSSFVQSNEFDYIWYNVSEDDHDYVGILSNLVSSIVQLIPKSKDLVLNSLQAVRIEASQWYNLCRVILNTIINSNKSKIILIFEDYYLSENQKIIGNIISQILEYSPPNLLCIVSTRENPNIPVAKLEAYGELLRINEHDLGFTISETRDYYEKLFSLDLTSSDLRLILEYTEGWPVGQRLLGETLAKGKRKKLDSIKDELNTGIKTKNFIDEQLYFYFNEQIFSKLSNSVKPFLLQTSLLESFDTSIISDLFNFDDPNAIIEYLIKKGCFIKIFNEGKNIYSYHHLFRDFLLSYLKKITDENSIKEQHKKIAQYYYEQKDSQQAISHYLKAKAFNEVKRILEETLIELLLQEKATFLLNVINRLSESLLKKSPAIVFGKGWASHYLGKHMDALDCFSKVLIMTNLKTNYMLFSNALLFLLKTYALLDQFEKALKLAKEHVKLLNRTSVEFIEVGVIISISYLNLKDVNSCDYWWKQIESVGLKEIPESRYIQATLEAYKSSNYYFWFGEFSTATSLLESSLAHFRKNDRHRRLPVTLGTIGILKFEMGLFEDGLIYFKEAADEILNFGPASLKVYAFAFLSLSYISLGMEREAEASIKLADNFLLEDTNTLFFKLQILYFAKAMLGYAKKSETEFYTQADKTMNMLKGQNILLDISHVYPAFAICYANFGDIEKGKNLLIEALEEFSFIPDSYIVARMYLILASLELEQGNKSKALEHLLCSIKISAEKSYDYLYLCKEREHAKKILPLALEQRSNFEFIAKIVIKLNDNKAKELSPVLESRDKERVLIVIKTISELKCRDSESKLAALTNDKDDNVRESALEAYSLIRSLPAPPLNIKMFGGFRVRREEQEVSESDWKRKLSKSVLQYLILSSKRLVETDELIEVFFVSDDTNKSRQNLHQITALLRKTLEPEITPKRKSSYVLFEQGTDAYRISLPKGSFVDLFEFENHIEQAENAQKSGNENLALRKFLLAIDLYAGDLFHQQKNKEPKYLEHVTSRVNFCRKKYISALFYVSEVYSRRCEFERSEEFLELLLAKDRFHSDANLLNMKNCLNMGNRIKAIDKYRHYKKNLLKKYKIKPQKEMIDLFEQITSV